MKVSPYGLSGEQWAIGIAAGLSTWVAALAFKLVPDRLFPQFGAKKDLEPIYVERKFTVKDRILSSRVSQALRSHALSPKKSIASGGSMLGLELGLGSPKKHRQSEVHGNLKDFLGSFALEK